MQGSNVLNLPGLSELRAQSPGEPDLTIALIDSRVDFAHPCFAGALLSEVMPAWLRSRMAPSGASHGTHIASVLFGQPGTAVEGLVPRCSGLVVPVYGEDQGGRLAPCSQLDLARAISLALAEGAQIINISGGELIEPDHVDPYLARAIEDCERHGVIVVAATGNDGCACLHAPASLETVLAVGAADADGSPMPFSNWHESLAGHGVLAPGDAVLGAVPGNGVVAKSGTSFACPIVTGTVALLLCAQRRRDGKPSPKAVRDAIVQTAIPCAPQDEAACHRMLGGRINVPAAYERLSAGAGGNPSTNGLQTGAPSFANRSPPEVRPSCKEPLPGQGSGVSINLPAKGKIMASEQTSVQPHQPAGSGQGAAPRGAEVSGAGSPGQIQGSAPPVLGSAAAEVHPAGAASQGGAGCGCVHAQSADPAPASAQLHPSGDAGYGDGGGQAAPAMAPAAQVVPAPAPQGAPAPAQPQAAMPQGPSGCGGMAPSHAAAMSVVPPPAVSGYAQAGTTPAQRTAMMFGGGVQGSAAQVPARVGVAPSQTHTSHPMATDFITAQNSQLVYCIGEIGYDFITDARRDYYVQQIMAMSADHDYIAQFTESLGLEPGPIYLPEDNRAMSAFLYQGNADDVIIDGNSPGQEEIGGLVWVLFQEGQPLYALRPLHSLAFPVLVYLARFLFDQSRVPEVEGNPNPRRAERVSIAGRLIGDITLYNGQTVPVIDVALRQLFNWRMDLIVEDVLDGDSDEDVKERLENFLDRVYYEVRNLGQTPQDRAINYLATNAFQAKKAFTAAAKENLELDSIYAEPSPICRPKSDCYDTIMRFFDPKDRLGRAIDEYRLTVDVNDVVPIGIGEIRKWARFA